MTFIKERVILNLQGGLLMTELNKDKALSWLAKELEKGDNCAESYTAEQVRAMLNL